MITAVCVTVPVHDEASRLPACLAALDEALWQLPDTVRRYAVVVLDACADTSPAIARRWGPCLELAARNVGQARAAGMAHALAQHDDLSPEHVWLATTDADSTVPARWLTDQLALADTGARAVAGTIRVADWRGYAAGVAERFRVHYAPDGSGDRHRHIHGANLGIRADAYLAVGGFAPLPTGEDQALWAALRARHYPCVATRAIEVITSARRRGRAPGGFSQFLRDFEAAS